MKVWVIWLVLFGFTDITIASSFEIAKQSSQEKPKPANKKSAPKHDLRTVIG